MGHIAFYLCHNFTKLAHLDHELRGCRYPAHPLHEVEGHPLRDEDGAGRPSQHTKRLTGPDSVAIGHAPSHLKATLERDTLSAMSKLRSSSPKDPKVASGIEFFEAHLELWIYGLKHKIRESEPCHNPVGLGEEGGSCLSGLGDADE